jgi:hypothetical protein
VAAAPLMVPWPVTTPSPGICGAGAGAGASHIRWSARCAARCAAGPHLILRGVHAEVSAAVRLELVVLLEAVLRRASARAWRRRERARAGSMRAARADRVEEQLDALARGQLARLVLLLDARDAAAEQGLRRERTPPSATRSARAARHPAVPGCGGWPGAPRISAARVSAAGRPCVTAPPSWARRARRRRGSAARAARGRAARWAPASGGPRPGFAFCGARQTGATGAPACLDSMLAPLSVCAGEIARSAALGRSEVAYRRLVSRLNLAGVQRAAPQVSALPCPRAARHAALAAAIRARSLAHRPRCNVHRWSRTDRSRRACRST